MSIYIDIQIRLDQISRQLLPLHLSQYNSNQTPKDKILNFWYDQIHQKLFKMQSYGAIT